MHDSKKILILGGDKRQKELAKILDENNKACISLFDPSSDNEIKRAVDSAYIVILPLPVTKDNANLYSDNADNNISLECVLSNLNRSKRIIGGSVNENLRARLADKNIEFHDFYEDESFITYNAFLTAQGAVQLMLDNTDEYVVGKKVLITGFGRVGKAVSHFMKVMGLDVYVAARSEIQRSEAMSYGYKALDISDIASTVYIYDFIINTIAHVIFDESSVAAMKNKAVFIELASKPFGAKKSDFDKHDKHHILAASLPGRLYPSASAKAIYKAIEKYL